MPEFVGSSCIIAQCVVLHSKVHFLVRSKAHRVRGGVVLPEFPPLLRLPTADWFGLGLGFPKSQPTLHRKSAHRGSIGFEAMASEQFGGNTHHISASHTSGRRVKMGWST